MLPHIQRACRHGHHLYWSSSSSSRIIRQSLSSTSIRSPFVLHAEKITGANVGDDHDNTIVFLHGLLGQGRNLKCFAKQVCAVTGRTGYLLDLRGHGASRLSMVGTSGPLADARAHSFADCVGDVDRTIQALNVSCRTLIGHSWGGRMALQYASEHVDRVDRVWLLDVVPGQANDSVEKVVTIVSNLQDAEFKTKKELVHRLTNEEGLDMATAQWLASSYVGPGNFGFDLEVVHDILPEFGTQDFDGMLTTLLEANVKVDMIRGGKNKAWNVETLDRLEKLTKMFPDVFGLHVLPKAGHWVHVDDLKGLVNIITSS
mgnify:CR=1 FL=1